MVDWQKEIDEMGGEDLGLLKEALQKYGRGYTKEQARANVMQHMWIAGRATPGWVPPRVPEGKQLSPSEMVEAYREEKSALGGRALMESYLETATAGVAPLMRRIVGDEVPLGEA